MTIVQLHQFFLTFPYVCTDTRKIKPNCIFFALRGENFNGNIYAKEALEKGASYVIVDDATHATDDNAILVKNVLETLQELAKYHRNYSNVKVIGITGSNGKTTTKELITTVLSKKYRTIATIGNLNNHIGVPLTLLSIRKDTEIAIVEMGANHVGEIAFLCSLAQPDFGYITNFGKAHIEGFGSVAGVIKGKSELYDNLKTKDAYIFMNADDPIQKKKLDTYIKKIGYSADKEEFYTISFISADPYVALKIENNTIQSKLVGSYNFTNCCAAVLMGKYFNVPMDAISNAIENYIPENNRSQIIEKNGHRIILDAYNANPTSMMAALENFNTTNASSKTVFLGDMFELGEIAIQEHQAIADIVLEMNFDTSFLLGEYFYATDIPLQKFKNFEALAIYLKEKPLSGQQTILIKGSRGMALEQIIALL